MLKIFGFYKFSDLCTQMLRIEIKYGAMCTIF